MNFLMDENKKKCKFRQKEKNLFLFSSEGGNLRGNMTALCTTVKVMGYKKQEKNKFSRKIMTK